VAAKIAEEILPRRFRAVNQRSRKFDRRRPLGWPRRFDLDMPATQHRPMRLEPHEIAAIRNAVRAIFGTTATVRVFGSRVHDHVRGAISTSSSRWSRARRPQQTRWLFATASEGPSRNSGSTSSSTGVASRFRRSTRSPCATEWPLTGPEPALLRQGLQAAERCAMRLERSIARLQGASFLSTLRASKASRRRRKTTAGNLNEAFQASPTLLAVTARSPRLR
jgi:hypothetical protein